MHSHIIKCAMPHNMVFVSHAHVRRIQDLANGLNNGEQIDAVFLDFSEAFDRVPLKRIQEKL